MFCNKCGAQNEDGAQFCRACGQKLRTAEDQSQLENGQAATTSVQSGATPVPHDPSVAQESLASGVAGGTIVAQPRPRITKTMIIVGIVIVIIAAVVAILLALGVFSSSVKIDEKSFPNSAVRQAVQVQLDIDGDGVLSKEEMDAVTSFAYDGQNIIFGRNEASVDPDAIRENLQGKGGSSSSSYGNVGQDIKIFHNIKAVVAPDSGLTEFDPSAWPDAEFFDLRGNAIASLDLSKNKAIRTLYCEPEVTLTGLDEANLYFRDLLTNARPSRGSGFTVEYDMFGRPLAKKSNGSFTSYDPVFTYDDQGRLISRAPRTNATDDNTNLYTYNDKGQLATWSEPMDVCPELFTFTYDENGLPVKVTEADEYSNGMTCDMTYEDGMLVSSNASSGNSSYTYTTSIQYDFDGLLLVGMTGSSQYSTSTTDPNTTSFTNLFDVNGALIGVEVTSTSSYSETSNSLSVTNASLTQTENGFPQKFTYTSMFNGSPSWVCEETYVCNSDGYITKTTDRSDTTTYMNIETSYEYVKFVSSNDYLLDMRYVPTLRVAIDSAALGFGNSYPVSSMVSEDLSWGDFGLFRVESFGPQCFNAQVLGLDPQFLLCPNEIAIQKRMVEMYKTQFTGE